MTVGYITTIVIVIVIMFSSSFSTSSHNVKSDLFYLFSDAKVYSYLFPFPATCWADRLVPCAITISTKLVSLIPHLIHLFCLTSYCALQHRAEGAAPLHFGALTCCVLPTCLYNLNPTASLCASQFPVNFSLSPVSGFCSTFPLLKCS